MIATHAMRKTRAVGVLLGGSGRTIVLEPEVKMSALPALPALLRPRPPDIRPHDQPCELRAAA